MSFLGLLGVLWVRGLAVDAGSLLVSVSVEYRTGFCRFSLDCLWSLGYRAHALL
ncbi:hypothetical protein M408DRAFT_332383 [Serendipita vermifera MAFF 305830]|uniref:Uncharacterized protein n=1 Tax=Serendipita vermifera MAFF 305830 TaxID=933852 RepID=A0A0C2X1I0_SERVB|nr:hypothetical protein M408DRAFT_332383 [Serendipita vermifera MAFF 305830]